MEDRLIDLSTMLQLIESRSDYVRIARHCLLSSESDKEDLNPPCDTDENDSVGLCTASEAATELHELVILHLRGQHNQGSFVSRCFINTDSIGKYTLQAIRSLFSLPCWSQAPW